MRRLARRLFTLCWVVSLVLCAPVCLLWVRSYWVEESLRNTHEKGLWQIDVSLGVFSVYHERIVSPTSSYSEDEFDPHGLRHESDPEPAPPAPPPRKPKGPGVDLHFGSLRIWRYDGIGSAWESIIWYVTVPCWLPAGMLITLPSLRVSLDLLRRRSRPGLCPSCGYDLRASPDRCPECGRAATVAALR